MRKLYDFKDFFCSQGLYFYKIAHTALRWCKMAEFKNTCSLYEFLNLNLQIFCKAIEGDERRIPFSTLKKRNISSVKTDIKCHSLLTDAFFKPDFSQLYAKFYQDIFKIFVGKIFVGFGFVKFHGSGKKYTCHAMCLSVHRSLI